MSFAVPPELEAQAPPELRGLRRDRVRLMVLPRVDGAPVFTRFDSIGDFLRQGDLLVVNNSRTLPAMLRATDEAGRQVEIRLANRQSDSVWEALILNNRTHVGREAMQLDFGEGLTARVIGASQTLPFLWQLEFDRCCADLLDLIYRVGSPIRYKYVADDLPLDLYQTVYAGEPGSVEMVSAGRPFTWELLMKLQRKGIALTSISLHTGLSSTRDDAIDATHPNYEEEFRVTESAAQAVNSCHAASGRVIAVGTTVVRALETQASEDGTLRAGSGRTQLRIGADYRLRVVDGLITGLHEPESSHMALLSAFVKPERLLAAYREAIENRYLWHEFGDVNLIV